MENQLRKTPYTLTHCVWWLDRSLRQSPLRRNCCHGKSLFVLVFDLILYICICNWIYLYLSLYLITNICVCNCRTEVCNSGVWGKVLPRHNFLTIPNSYFSSGPTGMRNFESNFSFEDGNLIMLNALTAGALRNPSIGSFPPLWIPAGGWWMESWYDQPIWLHIIWLITNVVT